MGRVLVSVLIGILLLSGFGALAPDRAAAQSNSAFDLIALVNQYRAANGQGAFQIDDRLMAAAQRHANWMAANNKFSHRGEGGSSPQDRATAAGYRGIVYENIAGGTPGWVSIEWAVEWWSNSAVHNQTMLSNNDHVGAGVATSDAQLVFVLVVGSPSANAPALPDEEDESEEEPEVDAEPTAPPIIVVPIQIAAPRADGSVVHVVQQGQTAWAIAARYEVTLDDLLAINHLTRNSVLHPGDEVIVRLGEGQAPPPSPTPITTHVVREGETLWTVAAIYGLTLDELLALNGMKRGDIIVPGDVLLLRPEEPTPTPTATVPTPTPTITPSPTATMPTDTPAPDPTATATVPTRTPAPASTEAAMVSSLEPTRTPTATVMFPTEVKPTRLPMDTFTPVPQVAAVSSVTPTRTPASVQTSTNQDDDADYMLIVVFVGLGLAAAASIAVILMSRRR